MPSSAAAKLRGAKPPEQKSKKCEHSLDWETPAGNQKLRPPAGSEHMHETCSSSTAAELQGAAVAVSAVQPSSEEQLLHSKRAAESLRTAIAHCASAEPQKAAVEAAPAESAPSWGSGGQLWERPGCAAEPSWGRAAFAPIRPTRPSLPGGGSPGRQSWCRLEEKKLPKTAGGPENGPRIFICAQ